MNAPAKLGTFAVALAAVLGAATAVGAATGPIGYTADDRNAVSHSTEDRAAGAHAAEGTATPPSANTDAHASADTGTHTSADTETPAPGGTTRAAPGNDLPGGLAMSQDGYTLRLTSDQLPAGQPATLGLNITGPDGRAVTAYTPTHDKELHLIVVRRDLSGFQHLHPVRDDAGTWTVPVTLATGGEYRVFADFKPAGRTAAMTLGADLSVAGDYQPRPLPAPRRTATVEDYTVTLAGNLVAGQESKLTLNVSKDGRPVTDLQPYLAAYGHLVVLRDGDLAYLHVHPDGEPGDGRTPAGPGITFYATAPTAGTYRLFLDFRHHDDVRTAEFTARAEDGRNTASADGHSDGHGH